MVYCEVIGCSKGGGIFISYVQYGAYVMCLFLYLVALACQAANCSFACIADEVSGDTNCTCPRGQRLNADGRSCDRKFFYPWKQLLLCHK